MDERTIIRIMKDRTNPYVILNKDFLNNEALSWKAKGLLAYILSKPDDWRLMIADLIKKGSDGRESVYSGIRELIQAGYIIKDKERTKEGRFNRMAYTVYEKPESLETSADLPHTENPYTDCPQTDKPPLLNNKRSLLRTDLNNNRACARTTPNRGGRNEKIIPQKNYEQREYDPTFYDQFYFQPPESKTATAEKRQT